MPEPLTCEAIAVRGLIERYLARRLSSAELSALESHLLTCPYCQRELRIAAAIKDSLGPRDFPWHHPPS